jgi:hypothetical protein
VTSAVFADLIALTFGHSGRELQWICRYRCICGNMNGKFQGG